jgi:hypothetical protein
MATRYRIALSDGRTITGDTMSEAWMVAHEQGIDCDRLVCEPYDASDPPAAFDPLSGTWRPLPPEAA